MSLGESLLRVSLLRLYIDTGKAYEISDDLKQIAKDLNVISTKTLALLAEVLARGELRSIETLRREDIIVLRELARLLGKAFYRNIDLSLIDLLYLPEFESTPEPEREPYEVGEGSGSSE